MPRRTIPAMTTYPNGYGKQMISLDEMKRKHGAKMHPEFARRFFHWIEQQGGKIGVGSAWRKTPAGTSGASRAGRSFHQDQKFSSGFVGCSAVDMVHVNGNDVHRSPSWSEVPKQGSDESRKWGLHCNVSGEPWHIQCIEQDGWATWSRDGRHDPNSGFALPDGSKGVKAAAAEDDPKFGGATFVPGEGEYGLWPLEKKKATVKRGSDGDVVEYLQAVMRNQANLQLAVDGDFGERTEACVKSVQRWNDLAESGICDASTWVAIDTYATR